MGVITSWRIVYNYTSYTFQIEVTTPEGCEARGKSETFSTAKSYEVKINSITPNTSLNLMYYKTGTSRTLVKMGATPPFSAVVNSNKISVELNGTSAYKDLYIHETPQLSTPTGLYADNITSDSARTNWQAVENASNYKVQYKAAGDTVWTETYTD